MFVLIFDAPRRDISRSLTTGQSCAKIIKDLPAVHVHTFLTS